MKTETAFQEKEQEMKKKAKAKAAKVRTKTQNDTVGAKGKGKSAVVAGESSKFVKQKGKEVIYDLLLLRIFAYFNRIY